MPLDKMKLYAQADSEDYTAGYALGETGASDPFHQNLAFWHGWLAASDKYGFLERCGPFSAMLDGQATTRINGTCDCGKPTFNNTFLALRKLGWRVTAHRIHCPECLGK